MTRRLVALILCGGVATLGGACATKSFVREEVDATERRLYLGGRAARAPR